jgi:glycerol-3-phosphate acyltransferase PlsX
MVDLSAAPVRVALDAFGGDNAPDAIVAGALAVAGENIQVLLVGREADLKRALPPRAAHIEIVDAPDVIKSGDEPVKAVRGQADSSLVVAAKLVATGRADAFVSAGNTGAVVAAGLLHVRRMKGVIRPAICVALPALPSPVVFLDIGANAEVRSEHLRQFAIMGQAYASAVLGLAAPTVGLLSIGEEPTKGGAAVIEAHAVLAADSAINFRGNVEGRDVLNHVVDVVVTDGFTGNVALKVMEGTATAMFNLMRAAAADSPRAKIGGLLLRPALRGLRAALDPEEYGGTYLLGLNGVVIIAHGNSQPRGVANAVRTGARGVRSGLLRTIAARIDKSAEPR